VLLSCAGDGGAREVAANHCRSLTWRRRPIRTPRTCCFVHQRWSWTSPPSSSLVRGSLPRRCVSTRVLTWCVAS
jgi:hypothetical protein